MYDIRSAMLNIGIVFTPGKFKINLEKTWKTPGILVNLRSTDPGILSHHKDKYLERSGNSCMIDENDSFSEYNKIPLSYKRTKGAVYSKIYLKVEICSARQIFDSHPTLHFPR